MLHAPSAGILSGRLVYHRCEAVNEIQRTKAALRKQAQALRDGLPKATRAAWSAAICDHIVALPSYQAAQTVHVFLSIKSEVDTTSLIKHALDQGKRVAVPIVDPSRADTPCAQIKTLDESEIIRDAQGLRMPKVLRLVSPEAIDLVLVPLLAFSPVRDEFGRLQYARLGYGAGYYDTFLHRIRDDVPKIGLAFSVQAVPSIPVASWDVLLDDVVTEQGLASLDSRFCLPIP